MALNHDVQDILTGTSARYLIESDRRLRDLERKLNAGDTNTAYAYYKLLSRHSPVLNYYMDIVDLLHGKVTYYKVYKASTEVQFKGSYNGVEGFINIKISDRILKGYLSLNRGSNKPFVAAEMASLKTAPLRPGIISVVRGYSKQHTYGHTLAGWPHSHQTVWIREPSKMLDAMADYVDSN